MGDGVNSGCEVRNWRGARTLEVTLRGERASDVLADAHIPGALSALTANRYRSIRARSLGNARLHRELLPGTFRRCAGAPARHSLFRFSPRTRRSFGCLPGRRRFSRRPGGFASSRRSAGAGRWRTIRRIGRLGRTPPRSGPRLAQLDPRWGMITRVALPANPPIHTSRPQLRPRSFIHQQMIDAQSRIPRPVIAEVIPERIHALIWMQRP